MKPALTAEEWAELGINTESTHGFQAFKNDSSATDLIVEGQWIGPTQCHGLAALALYGQPFGFTREDVQLLRTMLPATFEINPEGRYANLADRIEALLPELK